MSKKYKKYYIPKGEIFRYYGTTWAPYTGEELEEELEND